MKSSKKSILDLKKSTHALPKYLQNNIKGGSGNVEKIEIAIEKLEVVL